MLRDPPDVKVKKEPKTRQLNLTTNEINRLKNSIIIGCSNEWTCLYCGRMTISNYTIDTSEDDTIKRIEHKKTCIVNKLREL